MFTSVRYADAVRKFFVWCEPLHIPMQSRLYHTRWFGPARFEPLGSTGLPPSRYTFPFRGLARDCPVWTSPEFTQFSWMIEFMGANAFVSEFAEVAVHAEDLKPRRVVVPSDPVPYT